MRLTRSRTAPLAELRSTQLDFTQFVWGRFGTANRNDRSVLLPCSLHRMVCTHYECAIRAYCPTIILWPNSNHLKKSFENDDFGINILNFTNHVIKFYIYFNTSVHNARSKPTDYILTCPMKVEYQFYKTLLLSFEQNLTSIKLTYS